MLKILHFYLNNLLFITFLLWTLLNLQHIIKSGQKKLSYCLPLCFRGKGTWTNFHYYNYHDPLRVVYFNIIHGLFVGFSESENPVPVLYRSPAVNANHAI